MVAATFSHFGEGAEIHYVVQKKNGRWRVVDILRNLGAEKQSLAKDLAQSLARHGKR